MTSQATQPLETTVDVTDAISGIGESLSIAARVYLPAQAPRSVLVCWPGGSYDNRYWDFPADLDYSFADYMTRRGHVVVAADHLGVGRSAKPAAVDSVHLGSMAAAQEIFVRSIRQQHWAQRIPVVGVGHSLGGCSVVMTQAESGCYDRIANLGFTHGTKDSVATATSIDDERRAAVEQAKAFFADWDAGYALAPREPNHSWLYRPSTPEDVVALDDKTVTPWPRQAYVDAFIPGYTATFAKRVTSPLLVAFGDHDIPENPYADVEFYQSSNEIEFLLVEDTAHCHNFSVNRHWLWDRIGRFALANGS
ncbi:alpha/beta hydrolase [Nocardia jiangxiensis]|uniref:alpha/beta hydrolase n=1 Tax=Nocardia jiangxiensis TaxID=282685 RepID=UPI0009FDCA9C|nr:alpha/beta fold hydrolase [Nocardia jiangxiensis]